MGNTSTPPNRTRVNTLSWNLRSLNCSGDSVITYFGSEVCILQSNYLYTICNVNTRTHISAHASILFTTNCYPYNNLYSFQIYCYQCKHSYTHYSICIYISYPCNDNLNDIRHVCIPALVKSNSSIYSVSLELNNIRSLLLSMYQ